MFVNANRNLYKITTALAVAAIILLISACGIPSVGVSGVTMTKAEFDQLQTGMSYDDATKVIGGDGEIISESGKKGGDGLDVHTVMYQYKGSGSLGANANLMFQGEKLITKSQLGLK